MSLMCLSFLGFQQTVGEMASFLAFVSLFSCTLHCRIGNFSFAWKILVALPGESHWEQSRANQPADQFLASVEFTWIFSLQDSVFALPWDL